MTASEQICSSLSLTPTSHLTSLLNYAKKNTASSNTDLTLIATSDSSFPTHLCLIVSRCPFLATLMQSVSHLMLDRPTIILPQFSPSAVKSLLALFHTGQCNLSNDCGVKEIKEIMEAVGLNIGTEDFEVVKVEEVLSKEDAPTLNNNNISIIDTYGNIKIKIENELFYQLSNEENELDQDPEEVGLDVGSTVTAATQMWRETTVTVRDPIENTDEAESAANVEDGGYISLREYTDERGRQLTSSYVKLLRINSSSAVIAEEDEEAGGWVKRRKVEHLKKIGKSGGKMKGVKYLVEEEREMQTKKKSKRKNVNISRYGTICEFCKIVLDGEKELQEHQGMGDGHKYRCGVKQEIEMKRMAKSGKRKNVCLVCGMGFKTKTGLGEHAVVHTKAKDFSCDECNKSFARRQSLYFHNRKVHEGVKFRCEECGKQFGRKGSMTRHVKIVHEQEKPYKCVKCGVTFGMICHHTRHMKTVHM